MNFLEDIAENIDEDKSLRNTKFISCGNRILGLIDNYKHVSECFSSAIIRTAARYKFVNHKYSRVN